MPVEYITYDASFNDFNDSNGNIILCLEEYIAQKYINGVEVQIDYTRSLGEEDDSKTAKKSS